MAVTLKQIAEQSDVSAQTVSQILRGRVGRYHPETCERVLRTARALNYQPNLLSRALLGGKSHTVGLVMRGLGGAYNMPRLRALVGAAHEAGYLLYTVTLQSPGDPEQELLDAIRNLIGRQVDGLIFYRGMPFSPAVRRFLDAQTVPVVYLDWGPARSTRRIVFDRERGLTQLASYLVDLGHRRAAYFPRRGAADHLEQHVNPCQRIFARHGLEVDMCWPVTERVGLPAVTTHETVRSYLQAGGRATVLIVGADEAALGALTAIREEGLAVPDDLSLVGMDSSSADFVQPALTTLSGPREGVGEATFAMLHRLMTDPAAKVEKVVLPIELVVRKSTGPPPRRAR